MIGECERRIARKAGAGGAVLASRATMGLAAVLRGLGAARGSGVLMPVMLCANVVHAVRGAGLTPVFVDMDRRVEDVGFGMDLEMAAKVVAGRKDISVALAAPLFGGEVDGAGLVGLARKYALKVVADLAQCGIGDGEYVIGNSDDVVVAGVYSFGIGKVVDAGGGGAVVSVDPGLLGRVRCEVGDTVGLEEIAGRVMQAMDGADLVVEGTRGMARAYRDSLRLEGVEHPGGGLPVWKYSVLARDRGERDRVMRRLLGRGVEASNLYPPLVRWFGHGRVAEGFPVAADFSERIINLPLWPLRDGLLEDVVWAFGRHVA